MRASLILVAIGATAAAAASISSLPACGQTCIKNMLAIGPSLGCAAGNITCYCTQPDFGYGIRDCSTESCPTTKDANEVIAFGVAFCKKYLSGGSSGNGASSGAASATPEPSSLASASSAGATGGGRVVPLTTSTETGVETVKGKKVTTATGTTTVYGVATLLRTTETTKGSTITKVTGTTTLTGNKAKTAKKGNGSGSTTTKGSGSGSGSKGGSGNGDGNGNGSGSGSSSSSSGNYAPLATAAPGLFGAALVAVLAL